MSTAEKPIAQVSYEAYGDFAQWKNYRGDPMPRWDDLPPTIRDAWYAAIDAGVAEWRMRLARVQESERR